MVCRSALLPLIWESEKAGRAFVKMAKRPLWPEAFTWELVNEHTRPPDMMEWLAPLLEGKDAGLVSDGGLPCLADPGSQLVARAQELGIRVVPYPRTICHLPNPHGQWIKWTSLSIQRLCSHR
jgi:16S rRNA (cytidine1402-2'-O)-methyltransferase